MKVFVSGGAGTVGEGQVAGVGQLAQEQQNEHPVFITQHWTPLSPATLENSEG